MLSTSRRRLRFEVWIILGLSLGQSAVYSVVQLLDKMSRAPLAEGTSTLNRPQSSREYFDLTYQLLDIIFALVPVALVLFFLSSERQGSAAGLAPGAFSRTAPRPSVGTGAAPEAATGSSVFRRLGMDLTRPGRDLLQGAGLAALIGIPSLGLYAAGRAMGITTEIIPSALDAYWWTVPVLILSAVRHALVEEVIVVAYLLNRFGRFGWSVPLAILVSSVLRGSYHLYQGFGPFIGNVVMGIVFAWLYTKTGRVMPLIIAHALLDIVAFVGFSLVGTAIGLG